MIISNLKIDYHNIFKTIYIYIIKMNDLRKSSVYGDNQDNLLLDDSNNKRRCGTGMIKCLGLIIFLSGINAFSFYMGIKYANHLEDNSESF